MSASPFAIVLDNNVISAPVIREPINGGQGQISGQLHGSGRKRPCRAAACRRSAATLTVVEERTVDRALAATSINAGLTASAIGAAGVVIFMLVSTASSACWRTSL